MPDGTDETKTATPVDGAPEPFEQDQLARRETLELVRAYYRIADPTVRRRIFELTKTLSRSEERRAKRP